MNTVINTALENLSVMIQGNIWIAPVLALLAGVLTSVTPCSLSSVPLVVAFVGGTGQKDPAIAFRFSLVFALGMAVTFTALGAGASLLGKLLNVGTGGGWWFVILGFLMLAMALQTWGIISIVPSSNAKRRNTKRGYFGALIMGVLGGLFSSPCATPVLIALLAVVARSGKPLWGILLLFLYSVGHSILVIVAGTFMGFTGKLKGSSRYVFFAKLINILLGIVILAIGLYLLYLGF